MQWVYDAVGVIGMVLCIGRAIRVREDRPVWSLIALGFVFQVAGNEVYTALYGASTSPRTRPSPMRSGSPATCR